MLCVDITHLTKGTEVPLSWRLVAERADGMGLAGPTSTGSARGCPTRNQQSRVHLTFGLVTGMVIVCWRAGRCHEKSESNHDVCFYWASSALCHATRRII